ncbi:unnamed protein product [Linum trigynum]|uniref:F-box domain-containing protein n=1 Tax=Linum trigynum TaxID=586398 RepID=A0AAV2EYB4_9ROSI
MALLRKRPRSCSEVNPSSSMISSLGDDLLTEILIRLPNYRFAFWCKPVCKRWRSLISSPSFSCRFISHHRSMDKLPALLLHTDDASDPQSAIMRTYLVCNPFTKQWMALPLAPEKPMGYEAPVTRLVCEPLSDSNSNGVDQGFAFSSECRFRVVCIYQHQDCIKLDVYCSESGKWTKEPLVFRGYRKLRHKNVCSCNGELFWLYGRARGEEGKIGKDQDAELNPMLAVLNIFRLDIPATCIDTSDFAENPRWDISVSEDALHVIELDEGNSLSCLSVWKLGKDRLSWRRQCERLLLDISWCEYNPAYCKILDLHPERPHIVYFRYIPASGPDGILCCDLSSGKLEFFTELRQLVPRWSFFKPRVSCWPTPIPRYEELRGMYDGSCRWFRAANSNPLSTDLEQQAINALATVDVIRAATETLKNDWMDKLLALPRPGEKLHELHDWLRILRNELCELDSQREAILSL